MPTTRPNIRCSKALARPSICRPASQRGKGTGWPMHRPNAIRRQKAPTTEAMPGSATGKRSGIASKDSHTSRCRLLCPRASAIVPSIDARCAPAIRSTVARRFSFRNSDRLRAWGPLCSMAVQKMIEAGLPGFRVAARTRNPDACLAVGQASALGSSARAPPRSQRKLPSPRGLAGRDRKRVLMVGSQSFNPRACWRRSLLQARRPGAT